jgi:hypothetical protein
MRRSRQMWGKTIRIFDCDIRKRKWSASYSSTFTPEQIRNEVLP